MAGFATAYVIVDPGTMESRKAIQESVGLTNLEMDALGSGSVGFSDHGLTYFSRIKLNNMECAGLYTVSLGPILLWSLSTQPDERSLRNYTFDLVGDRSKALQILAQFYPRGAKDQIKTRRTMIEKNSKNRGSDFDEKKVTASVISTMAHEMVVEYQRFEMEQNMKKKVLSARNNDSAA